MFIESLCWSEGLKIFINDECFYFAKNIKKKERRVTLL